jgi:hypothetical protein
MKRRNPPAPVLAFSKPVPSKKPIPGGKGFTPPMLSHSQHVANLPPASLPPVTELCAQMRQWVDELQWLTLNKPGHARELLYLAHLMYTKAQKVDGTHGGVR